MPPGGADRDACSPDLRERRTRFKRECWFGTIPALWGRAGRASATWSESFQRDSLVDALADFWILGRIQKSRGVDVGVVRLPERVWIPDRPT
jgi:hypothetical protein